MRKSHLGDILHWDAATATIHNKYCATCHKHNPPACCHTTKEDGTLYIPLIQDRGIPPKEVQKLVLVREGQLALTVKEGCKCNSKLGCAFPIEYKNLICRIYPFQLVNYNLYANLSCAPLRFLSTEYIRRIGRSVLEYLITLPRDILFCYNDRYDYRDTTCLNTGLYLTHEYRGFKEPELIIGDELTPAYLEDTGVIRLED